MLKFEKIKITPKEITTLVGITFVCTGCAGLLAEQCFEKLLINLVGASTPSAAIVLSVYFLGLMLGAFLYSKVRDVRWKPLKVYALLEASIGVWAIFLLLSYQFMITSLVPVLSLGTKSFYLLQFLRFIVACIWILPPTMLMGATFPVIADFLESQKVSAPRKAMSLFYSLNLAGAILGAIIGPYWSFPVWGLHGTLIFTAIIDIVVSLNVFLIAINTKQRSLSEIVHASEIGIKLKSFWEHHTIMLIAFISGFLCFGLEVLWVHLIGAVLGNSVYAFAAMLFFVLAGLGIGGWLSVVLFKEEKPISPFFTSIILLITSTVLIWQYTVWPDVPNQLISWGSNIKIFWQGELLRWIQAGRLLLPVSIVMGIIYPAIFRMSIFPIHNRALITSMASGINSAGCIIGALFCGFVLIPFMGSEQTLILFGLISALAGLLLSLIHSTGLSRIVIIIVSSCLIVSWNITNNWNRLSLTSGGHVYFKQGHVTSTSKLAYFHEDTLGGITTVIYNSVNNRINKTDKIIKILLTNGKFQANDSISGEGKAQTGFALIPSLHTRCRNHALVIGLGSGHSAAIVNKMGVTYLDLAEISPGIVDAARNHFAHINGGILEQTNVRLFLEDGRNHLLLHDKKYDMITMEISSIWFTGSTSLYSKEFYELCKKRLNQGGIMQQWIQLHHIGINELGSVIATMRHVFPYVSLWVYGAQGILIGSETPQKIYADVIEKYFQENLWNDPDKEKMKSNLKMLLSSRFLAPEDVDRLVQQYTFEINTDANRFLEYTTPKYNLDQKNHMALNINSLIPFATFPEHVPEPAWPAYFANSAKNATEEMKLLFNKSNKSAQQNIRK